MKHLLTTILLLFIGLTSAHVARAQEEEPPPISDERLKEIKAQKTAYITTKLGLTSEEAQRFWPIYNEFDEARDKLRKEMRDLMKGGRKEGTKLTEAEAEAMLTKGLQLRQKEIDLERTYKDRFVKALGAVRTVELHKAERDFQREVLRRYRERQGDDRRGPPPGRP